MIEVKPVLFTEAAVMPAVQETSLVQAHAEALEEYMHWETLDASLSDLLKL